MASITFITTIVTAQTQEGFVMTIERPDLPSKAVSQAIIRVQGIPNAIISDNEGHFIMHVPEKKDGDELVILNVQKNGYELLNSKSSGCKMTFSTHVPIYILMVDNKQLAADKQRIEENAYRVAESNYKKKISILEEQLKEKTISIEKYKEEADELQKDYDRYLSLVESMADHYARANYNQLDSIGIEINQCIENGELEKADSLLHTIIDPETLLERNHAEKEEIRKRIAFAQNIIDKAQSDIDALMQDKDHAIMIASLCISLADEYLIQNSQTDAIRCLRQALNIQMALYGADSPEAIETQNRINELNK